MRRIPAAALAVATALTVALAVAAAPAAARPPGPGGPATGTAYRNPVSAPFADTFADPALIRGKDGWWYAYGTSDPLREGEGTFHRIPIARSADLVSWSYVGDAFTGANLPAWAAPDAGIWAPDIRYVDGQYRMYYVVTETTVTDERGDNAIGMATAPTPAGPWTDSGGPVVGPRRGGQGEPGNFLWTFDPTAVTEADGSQWLFYGSYYGGIFVTRLAADGRTPVGTPTMVAIDNKFEGAYLVRRDGWWYLFASTANCCAGPTTGYSVQVGRSRALTGPYLDADGVPLNQSRAGGTPVLTQNGNAWIGAGHNAVATDLAGQDWIVYHALDRADPYLDGTDGINERPMLLDRLDWIDGWPYVRAGRGPSANRQPGPATGGRWFTTFDTPLPPRWEVTGSWAAREDAQSGGFLRARRAGSVVSGPVRGDVRVEADLRSVGAPSGLVLSTGSGRSVRAVVDPDRNRLRLEWSRHGRVIDSAASRLPAGFVPDAWHAMSLEVRDGAATAAVSHARLGDPVALVTVDVPGARGGWRGGALAAGPGVGVDNLSVLPASRPVSRVVPDRVPDRLDPGASDEFDGGSPGPGWTWVRPDPAATVTGGVLRWPTQAADLVGTGNDAGVLLRPPGVPAEEPWTVETKVRIDLGTDEIRNFSQAGLIAYVDDDQFARFSHVAIWNTRQTEFGKEMPYAGRLAYGGTIVGPPAATTWLRLTHRIDPGNREHEVRAWSSLDGRDWVKGGVWTLPAGADLRVGLVSHGGAGATAEFDYFRVYR